MESKQLTGKAHQNILSHHYPKKKKVSFRWKHTLDLLMSEKTLVGISARLTKEGKEAREGSQEVEKQ